MVAVEYLKTEFLTDLVVFLPLGGILSLYDKRFEIFWLIKAIRIKDLHNYLGIRQFQPIINSFIEFKQQYTLKNPLKKDEMNEDFIYIAQKIYLRNMVKIMRLILYIIFITYFVGQYWFIIVDLIALGYKGKTPLDQFGEG